MSTEQKENCQVLLDVNEVLHPRPIKSDWAVKWAKRQNASDRRYLVGVKNGGMRSNSQRGRMICKIKSPTQVSECPPCGERRFTKCYCRDLEHVPSVATHVFDPTDRVYVKRQKVLESNSIEFNII